MYHTKFCAIPSCMSCIIVLCVVFRHKKLFRDLYYRKEECTLKIVLRNSYFLTCIIGKKDVL